MIEESVIVKSSVGLHARPAALFVQEANKYQSKIMVSNNDRCANAKSILGVLGIGAGKGAKITIRAEGTDEQEAVGNLVKLVMVDHTDIMMEE